LREICEGDRYIPIDFVKDLRAHIAAKRRSDFGPRGWPSPEIQECSPPTDAAPAIINQTTNEHQTNNEAHDDLVSDCVVRLIKCSLLISDARRHGSNRNHGA
jgi:hypothetical protein